MVKIQIFYLFYISCSFILVICGDFFCQTWSRSRLQKILARAGADWGKKSGAGAAWEIIQEPEPEKNYPAPQPWFL